MSRTGQTDSPIDLPGAHALSALGAQDEGGTITALRSNIIEGSSASRNLVEPDGSLVSTGVEEPEPPLTQSTRLRTDAWPSGTEGTEGTAIVTPAPTPLTSASATSSAVQPRRVVPEFVRELEQKFGKSPQELAKLCVHREPFFQRPSLWHLLHKPQLKQYFKANSTILVRPHQERKAQWNELFFDLVFICVFQRVAHELETTDDLDGHALTEFAVLFCTAWKIWFDLTVYVNQFDPADTVHKIYFLLQMIFVMGLAVTSVKGVIACYLLATGLTLALRCWAAYYSPRARQDAYAQALIYVLGAIPWLSSLAVHRPEGSRPGRAVYEQFQLWALGLFLAFGGQFLAQCHPRFHLPLNIEHVTERFGIFTILCMGEQVLSIFFTDATATDASFLMACLGGVMIFSVQILYYDVDGFMNKLHALHGSRLRGYMWALLHCPFHACIVVSSVAFDFFIGSTLAIHPMPELETFEAATMNATFLALEPASSALALGTSALEAVFVAAKHGPLEAEPIDATHRQLFCIANGGLLLALFCISCLHIGRDGHLIRRKWRLIARGVGTLAMFVLHLLGDRISPLGMAAYAGICLLLLAILDLYGSFVPRNKILPSAADLSSRADEPRELQQHADERAEHSACHAHAHTPSVMSRNY
jgi:low temperature requirement protein LtrA